VVGGPEQQLGKARWLWRMAAPARGTPAEAYLRSRGIEAPPPATIRFLLPRKPRHHPAMVVAFGLPIEPEPGVLDIADDAVRGVQLTLLRPDGSGKAKAMPNKLTIGTCSGVPMVLAAPNDLLGLAVAEGAEEALTVNQLTGLGAWAAGGASRLPALADAMPEYIDCVRVMIDADDAGRRGAHELARRLLARNFHVEVIAVNP
jgi:Toprim domain